MACHVGDRKGPQIYYKGRYMIVFYDKTGEHYINTFDNVREILAYRGDEITRTKINQLNVELCRSLKSDSHYTRMLNGKLMTVWLVDQPNEDEDDEDNEGDKL